MAGLPGPPKYDAPPRVVPPRSSLTMLELSVDRSVPEYSGRNESYRSKLGAPGNLTSELFR